MMRSTLAPLFLSFFPFINAQKAGTLTAEKQPPLNVRICNKQGCQNITGTVTVDANWRYTHDGKGKNCYKGNLWSPELCPDGATCIKNCVIDGADYEGTYGVTSTGDALTLKFLTKAQYGTNVGSRLYFLNKEKYQMFKLKNQEFSFDVDVSKLPCGINGALYFSAMEEDGGTSKFPQSSAGSKYGLGYCDAQCPTDLKFLGGKANSDGWVPSKTDPFNNTGNGKLCSCCPEMDIWEANSISQAFTIHSCSVKVPTVTTGEQCGAGKARHTGLCDMDGCDFASARWGAKEFYGPKKKVDTSKPMTVVTQFITKDGTDAGELTEIKRFYIQDGKTIENEAVKFSGLEKGADSLTQPFCEATKKFTGDPDDNTKKGGLKAMGDAMAKGMVLVMSLWDDQEAAMQWLDSTYPPDKPKDAPGVFRGTCDPDSGKPATVRAKAPDATVKFSNIQLGPIGQHKKTSK